MDIRTSITFDQTFPLTQASWDTSTPWCAWDQYIVDPTLGYNYHDWYCGTLAYVGQSWETDVLLGGANDPYFHSPYAFVP